jgi:hypothetical protein
MIVAVAILVLFLAMLVACFIACVKILKKIDQAGGEEAFAQQHRAQPRMCMNDRTMCTWGSFIIAWASLYLMAAGFVGLGSVIFTFSVLNFINHFVEMCLDMYADKVLNGEFEQERQQQFAF